MKDELLAGIVTGGYARAVPFLKGTFGTLGAVAIYLVIWKLAGQAPNYVVLGLLALVYTAVSYATEPWAQDYFAHDDPKPFIIDEWAGYFVTMLFIPGDVYWVGYGFLAFRVFDIIKPFPCRRLEKIRGGIVWDDLMAGVYANLLLQIIKKILT